MPQSTAAERPATSSASSSQPPTSTDEIYASLHSHPFFSDPEYLSGLASIFGHPETPVTQEEISSNPILVHQAKLFYFARKHNLPPIDSADYIEWARLRTQQQGGGLGGPGGVTPNTEAIQAQAPEPFTHGTGPQTQATALPTNAILQPPNTTSTQEAPPYPTSFAAIVDLITANKPIPGIEEIPDTVLELGSSKIDRTPRRKKPWEKDTEPSDSAQPAVTGGNEKPTVDKTAEDLAEGQQDNERSSEKVKGYVTTGEGVIKILQPNAIPPSGLLSSD